MAKAKPGDRRAHNAPGPLARPPVRRVELDDDVMLLVRNACLIRYGTAGKADVRQYVNDLVRAALRP